MWENGLKLSTIFFIVLFFNCGSIKKRKKTTTQHSHVKTQLSEEIKKRHLKKYQHGYHHYIIKT